MKSPVLIQGFLLLLASSLLAFAAGQPAASPLLPVGFVDMERIVREHPETKARFDRLDQETNEGFQKLRSDLERARSSEAQLDSYAEGSPEYIAQLTRIRQEKAMVEINRKVLVARVNLEAARTYREIYQLCRAQVGRIAKERGVQWVAMYSSADLRGTTRNEVLSDMITRTFLYHDAGLDLTEAVLESLKK
jgi:Skp family chaperone for outer membrane proteins